MLHGSPRMTLDINLCYDRSRANLKALAAALGELKLRLRGAPPDVLFKIDAEGLALGCNYTFSTDLGDVDFLGYLEPIGGYESVIHQAVTVRIDHLELKVLSLTDLIRIKEHLKQPKDLEALAQLKGILKIRASINDGDQI